MYWKRFNEWCARHARKGEIRRLDGIEAAWAHTLLIVHNLTAPAGPLPDSAGLQRAADAAVADAAPYGLPWMFGVPEPWMPVALEEANALLAPSGLVPLMYMTVMGCPGALADPVRPLPADVQVCRVDSRARGFDALDLNTRAYGMPAAVTADVLDSNAYFSDGSAEFGFVVYNRDGVPVSTATAVDLGECVYIAAVATDPGHRSQGFAELAVRAALAAAPSKPTALDASRSGEPLYAQMGYGRRFRWNFWVPATPTFPPRS